MIVFFIVFEQENAVNMLCDFSLCLERGLFKGFI